MESFKRKRQTHTHTRSRKIRDLFVSWDNLRCTRCLWDNFNLCVTHWQGALVSFYRCIYLTDVTLLSFLSYNWCTHKWNQLIVHQQQTKEAASMQRRSRERERRRRRRSYLFTFRRLHTMVVHWDPLFHWTRKRVFVWRREEKKQLKWKSATRASRFLSMWLSLSKNISFISVSFRLLCTWLKIAIQLEETAVRERDVKYCRVTHSKKDGTSHAKVWNASSTQDNLNSSWF